MSSNIRKKKSFLTEFQQRVIQGRKLLQTGNHHWATKLFFDLYYEIETQDWLNAQKKHQLISILSNSWWMYINSLKLSISKEEMEIIKYIDAYKRFLNFLIKLEDYDLFESFTTELLKDFINMKDLSISGITKFINSFSVKVIEQKDYLKLIELQILLIFLRKSVIPTEYFRNAMEHLGRIIYKLEPGRRPLFLFVILENVNIKFNLMDDSESFVKEVNNILINRIPDYLRADLNSISRVSINERTFNSIDNDLTNLIKYLNNIGESEWIIIIIRNLFHTLKKFKSYDEAINRISKFIKFAVNRSRFTIAFEIYNFLEDLFLDKSDLSYNRDLIELWSEACKKFVDMKEKKFLLQSIEKLNNHLTIPQTSFQIFHYFYTCNYVWKFKSMFFSLERQDFYRMIFYRALYELNDIKLAQKIIPFLDKKIQPLLGDLNSLYNQTKEMEDELYHFEDEQISANNAKNVDLLNMIIRINSEGLISYRIISKDGKIFENSIKNEFWNDLHLIEIYNDLYSNEEQIKLSINLREFGSILYLMLPKKIRDFFRKSKITSLNHIPQIYIILDHMSIPFELIYDGNFFLLNYSTGYSIGEPPIGGINFGKHEDLKYPSEGEKKYNILIIDSINALGPMKWNENSNSKELLFPFPAGANELQFITEFFTNREEVENIQILSGQNSTRTTILTEISKSSYHNIYIVGNIFYSSLNPKKSYFLTNNEDIVKISEIFDCLSGNEGAIKPLLFFNTQMYNKDGNRVENDLRSFGRIIENFKFRHIKGIISKNYPIFNEETKQLIIDFYSNLFNNNSLGISLLKARQKCIADRTTKSIQEQISKIDSLNASTHIDIENSQAISSFILFGEPWQKL